MTDIPKAAIEAVASDIQRSAAWYAEASPEDIAEEIIRSALPHLDGYAAGFAAGFAAGQEAAAAAVEARAIALGRAECCGYGIGSPPECCSDPIYMISNTEAAAEIRALPIAPAPEQPDDAADRLAAAYQIVGALADAAGVMDTPEVQAALDYLSGKPDAPCPLPFAAPSPWRSISEAPRDGAAVLLFFPKRYQGKGGISWGCWVDGGWLDSRAIRDNDATHWMPLPAPPDIKKEPQA